MPSKPTPVEQSEPQENLSSQAENGCEHQATHEEQDVSPISTTDGRPTSSLTSPGAHYSLRARVDPLSGSCDVPSLGRALFREEDDVKDLILN